MKTTRDNRLYKIGWFALKDYREKKLFRHERVVNIRMDWVEKDV